MIVNIYPVLIGDKTTTLDGEITYSDYFTSGCHPICTNNVIVDSVESHLTDHLNRLCCGTPLLGDMHVANILDSIIKNQGCLIDGPQSISFDTVIEDVSSMVKDQKIKLKFDDLEITDTSLKHSSGKSKANNILFQSKDFTAPEFKVKDMSIDELE